MCKCIHLVTKYTNVTKEGHTLGCHCAVSSVPLGIELFSVLPFLQTEEMENVLQTCDMPSPHVFFCSTLPPGLPVSKRRHWARVVQDTIKE